MIKEYTLKALQHAINHTLSLDETRAAKITELQGKVLHLIVTPLGVGFYLKFTQHELLLLKDYSGAIDTTIHSSPIGLIRLSLLPASKVRSLFNDQIKITGDAELGQDVKKLFDELDIDWEGYLAQFTGDVVAYQLGSMVRKGLKMKQQVDSSLSQSLTEYVQEELHFFPTREEVENWFNDVDALALRVERLEALMNQGRKS